MSLRRTNKGTGSGKVTARVLQRAFAYFYYLADSRFELLVPNTFIPCCSFESDLLGLRPSGYLDEIEIKLSKADFEADFKKDCAWGGIHTRDSWKNKPKVPVKKHELILSGKHPANRFSFLMPHELAGQVEVPEGYGLYLFRPSGNRVGGVITEARRGKLLHKDKITDATKYTLARKTTYRWWRELIHGKG